MTSRALLDALGQMDEWDAGAARDARGALSTLGWDGESDMLLRPYTRAGCCGALRRGSR